MKSQTVIFDHIIPHPEPVQIAALLNDIEAVIKKHVVLGDHAAAALAVWVLHTWTFELRDIVAYVAIESPEKRCGKTTLLSVLAAMAHKPLVASNVTVGALFRAIDTCRPTLFIDEADTFLAGNGTMRGIINSGNTWRTAYVLRLSAAEKVRVVAQASSLSVETSPQHSPDNPETGIKKYSCWCPKVIAMIGRVPDTIADRSVVVPMSRKLTTENCAPLAELESSFSLAHSGSPTFQTSDDNSPSPGGERPVLRSSTAEDGRGEGEIVSAEARGSKIPPIHGEGARQRTTIAEIRSKCARFALDAGPAIAQSPKIRGEGLNDRAADTFDPLYVIARLAGNGWEEKLHAAALALNSGAQTNNAGTELLLDILSIFIQTGREKIFSRDLVAILRNGVSSLKSLALKYSTLDEYRIAQILRPYGIKPSNLRIGKDVSKGYTATDFRDALLRYVPRADVEARFDELQRHTQLQAEAKAEAQKEAALMRQVAADMSLNKTKARQQPSSVNNNVAACSDPVTANVAD